jgi:uncharacterized membrane protein
MIESSLPALLATFTSIGFGLNALMIRWGLSRTRQVDSVTASAVAALVSTVTGIWVYWAFALLDGIPPMDTWSAALPLLLLGMVYPGVFRIVFYGAVDRVGPNLAGAITAANPLVASMIAIAALGESFTYLTAAGVVCIVAGAALLQLVRESADDEGVTDVVVRELVESGIDDLAYPVGAMLLVGVGVAAIKVGLNLFPYAVTATAVVQTGALAVLLAYATASGDVRLQLSRTSGERVPMLLFSTTGAIVALAWVSQFVALEIGTVVTVVPLVNTYPLFIALITYAIARQVPRSPRVLGAILAIVVGASLMQL